MTAIDLRTFPPLPEEERLEVPEREETEADQMTEEEYLDAKYGADAPW